MKWKVVAAAVTILCALPAQAQNGVERSIEAQGGVVVVDRRSIDIPDELGSAMKPYMECLSQRSANLIDRNVSHYDDISHAKDAIASCQSARDASIFLSATALERDSQHDLAARRSMIADTLDAIESVVFPSERPDLKALFKQQSNDR